MDEVGKALDALLEAVREEIATEDTISRESYEDVYDDLQEALRSIASLQRTVQDLESRCIGMVDKATRIRTKADMATGYVNESGGFSEAADKGRGAGAEGAVDRLIALYAGKVTKEKDNGGS